jgi:hypothetical protein
MFDKLRLKNLFLNYCYFIMLKIRALYWSIIRLFFLRIKILMDPNFVEIIYLKFQI